ncbi:FtsQ-type POTRA domain-containing protein [Candidatus Gottesmanbacteria bacterium]|nr:FtsQ-type POTRA domain-containing protein [Candidatus Gottesmanbacteria bacterium]
MSVSVALRKFGRPAILGIAVLLGSGAVFWLVTGAFALTTVEVVGDGVGIIIDQQKLPKNLLLLPTDKLEASLRYAYPLLASVRVTKRYPHTLVIATATRKPIVRIGNFLLDKEGIVVDEKNSSEGLPLLDLPVATMTVGSKLSDPAVVTALGLVAKINPAIAMERIAINDSTSLIAKSATTDILFTQDANAASIATTLQTLFDGFRIKGTLPTRIDLRFDKPVVTF